MGWPRGCGRREPSGGWAAAGTSRRGGADPAGGQVIDARHPERGASLAGRVVVMPAARGSSSSSSVLAEAVRAGYAPAGILLAEVDLILAVGAAVAEELYGVRGPIVGVAPEGLALVRDGQALTINREGEITLG